MNEEKIKQLLQQSQIPENPEGQKAVQQMGSKMIREQHLQHTSIKNLFFSSLRFINWRVWLIQMGLFLLALSSLSRTPIDAFLPNNFLAESMSILTGLLLLSFLFLLENIYRSFTYGMWELEASLKYNLQQHSMMKLLIFSVFDFIFALALALLSYQQLGLTISQAILYLLVPFNLFCLLALTVFSLWHKTISRTIRWAIALTLMLVTLWLLLSTNVYLLPTTVWLGAYILSLFLLIILIIRAWKNKNWMVN